MIAEALIKGVKLAAIIAVVGVFMVAINSLIAFITSAIFSSVIGEVMFIASACLPFNALLVFGGLITVCNAILAFLIAKKIFDLTSWSISTV